MQAVRALGALPSEENLVTRARLAIQYHDGVQRLPLVRLDRQGFVIALTDDAGLPPLGLPRTAQVFAADELLCELRLVARSLARDGDRVLSVTMQPSRADDDTVFWQALHRYARTHAAPTQEAARQEAIAKREHARQGSCDGHAHRHSLPATACESLFALPSPADAQFFSEWLEYHFAEIHARARCASSLADLAAMERHTAGLDVQVIFHYRPDIRDAQRCTEALCAWAVSEAAARFGLAIRHEMSDVQQTARTHGDNDIRLPFAS